VRILLAQNAHYVPTHGGGTKANRMWLEELARKGHQCRAIARSTGAQGARTRAEFLELLAAYGTQLSSSAGDTDVFRYQGVEVHAVTDVPRLRDALVRQIGEFEPTWVLVSTADPGQVLLESALESCPGGVIYIAHTPQMFPFGPESFWPSAAGTDLLRRTAAIVTIGRTTASYVREFTGVTPVVIHPPSYGPGPFADYGARNQGCITLVNPSAVKGLPIFLALAARLRQQEFAALLGWSQGTFASKVEIDGGKAKVTREVDGGLQTVELKMPAIVTTDLRLNQPRYASLPNIMKAKKKPLDEKSAADYGADVAPRLKVLKTEEPGGRKAGVKVKDVAELVDKLKNEAGVL